MTDSTCVVDGCDQPVLVKLRGLCRRHYLRWQRYGDPLGGTFPSRHAGSCLVDGCERPASGHGGKGYCGPHYMRLWRGQDPTEAPPIRPAGSWPKFLAKIKVQMHPDSFRPELGPCWLWQGTITEDGRYGQVRRKSGLTVVHRYAYEHEVGPIPDGLDLDHLCRIRHCCNPAHLEPVTRGENLRRGYQDRPRSVPFRKVRR